MLENDYRCYFAPAQLKPLTENAIHDSQWMQCVSSVL